MHRLAPYLIKNPADPARRAWLAGGGALLAGLAMAGGAARAADDVAEALTGPYMPYAAFDRLAFESLDVRGGRIRVAFGPGAFTLARERILEYVRVSAQAVVAYFGRFPARDTRLLILNAPGPGRPVRSGTAFGDRGAAIKLSLSPGVSEAELQRDWILVHEMSHLALPSLPRRHHWLEEGMASYVEPLARAQIGTLGIDRVWIDMIRGMPQGLPQEGDQGLDRTPTWGRTYWGGALFCLLADVEIRERTEGHQGLQHALRAVLAHGNMEQDSALAPLLKIADQAVGVPVLSSLYGRMKDQPYPVDLEALWRKLGVQLDGQVLRTDDTAPLASIRRALTAPIPQTI